jgi:hypothetical protein
MAVFVIPQLQDRDDWISCHYEAGMDRLNRWRMEIAALRSR